LAILPITKVCEDLWTSSFDDELTT